MSRQVGTPGVSVARADAPPPPAGGLAARQGMLVPYLLVAPTGLFLAVFFAWPMLQALLLAFQTDSGGSSLESFGRMVHDYAFWPALRNTLLLIAVIVPVQLVVALTMALLLQAGLRGTHVFLYVWSIPLAISDLAAGIVWLAIFTDHGYLNSVLVAVGLSRTGFSFLSYQHPVSLFLAAVVAEVWRATSLMMVILVAGLQGIPKEYGEAAAVFGATFWQRIRYVTLPLLRPSLQVALILRTILAFQVFAVVIALAGRNLPVLAGEAYYWYSSYQDSHVAATYALLILGFSLISCIVYLRMLQVRAQHRGARP